VHALSCRRTDEVGGWLGSWVCKETARVNTTSDIMKFAAISSHTTSRILSASATHGPCGGQAGTACHLGLVRDFDGIGGGAH